MYIRRVTIRNIRGFKEIDLDFTRPNGSFSGWTVLAGRNGSGKSSLLKVLAYSAIQPPQILFRLTAVREWLRKGSKEGNFEIEYLQDGKPETRSLGIQQDIFSFDYSWTESTQSPTSKSFLCGYGPYRRLMGSAIEAQNLMTGADPIARVVTLFREDASLVESVTWLREIYLRRLEKGKSWLQLENTVLALLNDGLLPDEAFVEKIDSEGLWVRQHGVRLSLTELSDGYRTTAALVMDMIRNLHQCFGKLRVRKAKDKKGDYLHVLHEGVVLIDEVDLHLHLSWQKRIGFWLKRHFPKIQFIVTTHSPFVCQAADPRGLIRLPAPGETRPAEHVSGELYNTVINGSIDEAVLTDLFGLESPYSEQTERLRERVAELEARVQSGLANHAEEEEFDRLSARLPQTLPSAVEQALRKMAVDI